jgi:hypothetical protein
MGLFSTVAMDPPFAFLEPAKGKAPPRKAGAKAAPAHWAPPAQPLSPVPALEWVNAYGEIASWRNKWAWLGAHWSLMPAALVTVGCWSPSAKECLLVFLAWLGLAACALTMNHRYFAHCAFKTSRPMRVVCAAVGCLGLQYGPMWWSSKHRKHHKCCDAPGDPHSWRETSWWYMVLGERSYSMMSSSIPGALCRAPPPPPRAPATSKLMIFSPAALQGTPGSAGPCR